MPSNKQTEFHGSRSELSGLDIMPNNALQILSVGISTGGVAEMQMAALNPERHIIATSVDEEGVKFAEGRIAAAGLSQQITVKLEDVSKPLPYPDNHFDYIYARLVLHYLSKQRIGPTLAELSRVLKAHHKLFVVVRSVDCPDANSQGATYDEYTGLTRYTHPVQLGKEKWTKRYFHTEESIASHVRQAGFAITSLQSYDEHLYLDFMRTHLSPHTDNVIELQATNAEKEQNGE